MKQGPTRIYDPDGNPLNGLVDNADGSFDFGWLGQHQRGLDHTPGLQPVIQMGARPYDPVMGRFLEVDPIEGGNTNDYDYCSGDPIGCTDLDGQWGIRIGRIKIGNDGCMLGTNPNGSCRGSSTTRATARAVRKTARSTTRFVAQHRGFIATVAAGGACIVGGPGGCALAQAGALAVRSQQRGIRNVKANLIDVGITAATLGTVTMPGAIAIRGSEVGGQLYTEGLRHGQKWAASFMLGAMTDSIVLGSCIAVGVTRSGC